MENDKHLSTEDLAALAEGLPPSKPGAEVESHLERCVPCFEAYADLVRIRVDSEVRPERYVSREEWVSEILLHGPGRGRPSWNRIWTMAAAAAVLLLGGIWWTAQELTWQRTVDPVRDLVAEASVAGMVYPGVSPGEDREASPYRSGREPDARLEDSLEVLRKRFREQPGDKEAGFWLAAGLTVSGKTAEARSVVNAVRSHHPEDERLALLDAIVSTGEQEYDRARALLEEASEGAYADEARRNLRLLQDSYRVTP